MRPGLAADAVSALANEGWDGFELLATERSLGASPGLADAAGATHLVPPGQVPEVAAAILDDVGAGSFVALGGGRVVDAAKAVAAVRDGQVAAIPTTLSGAEMTAIHRLPAGHEGLAGVRPSLVLADAELMTSLPEPELRATAMNALAHAADSLYTPLADGLSRKAALRAAALIAAALDEARPERDRGELALGALLAGQAIDAAGLALHHVLSQSAVRVCGTPHAETNAALLPAVMEEMRSRAPERMAELAEALGCEPDAIAGRIEALGGGRRGLAGLGASRDCLEPLLDTAMARGELVHMTPGEVGRDDLAGVLERAW